MLLTHGSCVSVPVSIRLIHIQIKPHRPRNRDSTPAHHVEKCMEWVQSSWAFGAFTFVYLPMTAIVRFAVTTKRKQTSMEKSICKGAGSHWQITRPRDSAPSVDGTCPTGLSLQSFVKVVTFLMLFKKMLTKNMQTLSEFWREMQENTTTAAIRSTSERNASFSCLSFWFLFAHVCFPHLSFKITDCFISVFGLLD